jgi:hypothetical protein
MLALKTMLATFGLATSFMGLLASASPITADNNDLAIHAERANAVEIGNGLTKREAGPCEYEL